jgi:hypothetical protein
MSGNAYEKVGLSSIEGPSEPPSTEPDLLTKSEIKKNKAHRENLTPTELHDQALRKHVSDLRGDRDRFRKDCTRLQGELDHLRPEHAKLKEAYESALASNMFSTAMIGLGGSLISGAGYAPGEILKLAVLVAGVVTFGWGFVFQVSATWRSTTLRR